MSLTCATDATPGQPNEDYLIAGPEWVAVLDGATAPAGVDSGCIHDVPWLVRHLSAAMATGLIASETLLVDVVSDAIDAVCNAHAGTCDLGNPASPSSTVAILRVRGDDLDYLTLADSPIVLDTGSGVVAITDDRTSHLPSYTVESVRELRNQPGGFWVASTNSEAAYAAVHGSVRAKDVRRAAVLSDGGARYVERFGLSDWAGLLDLLESRGPVELIRRVRQAERVESEDERRRERRRGKRHDDATVAFVTFH
ncbi:MAG: protein phosphatase 2C domain-containing protein [Haloechinothrix sp.]